MDIAALKAAVEAGGGIWRGFQELVPGDRFLVLFDSPATRSTLALKPSQITAEAVQARIAASNKKFSN